MYIYIYIRFSHIPRTARRRPQAPVAHALLARRALLAEAEARCSSRLASKQTRHCHL